MTYFLDVRFLLLPKGKYVFKFIVDDIQKCSNNYPKINDNRGNVNNYIDIDIDNSNNEKDDIILDKV